MHSIKNVKVIKQGILCHGLEGFTKPVKSLDRGSKTSHFCAYMYQDINKYFGTLIAFCLFVCFEGRQGEADELNCNLLQRVGIPFFRDLALRP